MKKILSISSLLFVAMYFAQTNLTSSENYVYSKTCLNGDCSKVSENVQYFDGWGKPVQTIDIKATPLGRDIVSHIEYDPFGRQTKSYLPVPQATTQNGAIYASPLANASAIYGAEKIYSEKILENSPIERIQQQIQAGNNWANKPVNFNYNTNEDGEVRKYTISTDWFEGRTKYTIANSGNYAGSTLTKNVVTNEDNNVSIEFKNKKGQTVLLRRKDGNKNADTYYIYNEYGQLAYVIPPLAAQSGQVDQTTLDNLCYQYHYDGWNRLVEKKIPGKGWEYMVYDKQDRMILSQNANTGALKQWFFTKYDQFGRVLYTGIYTSAQNYGSTGRQAEQTLANSSSALNESRNTSGFDANGVTAYYTNSAYPAVFTKILTINYYDTYLQNDPARPAQIMGSNTIGDNAADAVNTQTLPTLSMVKNIEDDNWTKSYIWYDTNRRPIGSYAINHLGGYTKTESSLDFTGVVLQTKIYHKRLSSDTEKIISQTYEYDSQNRLKKQWHQVNSNPQELLSQNSYNELSQLTNKKVGNNLQSIDYTYNLRGAITTINDPANLGTDLFAYSLSYFDPTNTSAGKYSGNISSVSWKSAQDNVLRKYSYQYDNLNRLSQGIYAEPEASVPQNNFYNEIAGYDLGGNIISLQRYTKGISGTASLMDNLSYVYSGNRLTSVTDSSTNYSGYPDTSGNTISYDANGNMTSQIDKGILQIEYNILNKPVYLKFNTGLSTRTGRINENTSYLYRADGTKLRKVYNYAPYNPLGTITQLSSKVTEYLDGFQYEGDGKKGIPSVLTLKFVPTAEGYYNFENNKYIYSYTDHLGNIRVSYFKNTNGSAEVLEENNFYPFGMKHEGYNQTTGNPAYSYQYNGKELQTETGWSDYGARMYMSDIARWGVTDPLAETSRRWSPYAYAYNNPVMFLDPDGMQNVSAVYWEFDPNTTLTGGDYFAGSTLGAANFSNQMSLWQDAAGGGGSSTPKTFGETQAYKDLMTAWQNGQSFGLFNNGSIMSWWTDADGAQYGQYNMLKLANENYPSNKEITPWQLGVEWLSGNGPRHRDFTNGDLMTEMLRKHSHVQVTRDIILSKMALGKTSLNGSNSYKLGGIRGIGLYLKDYSTLLTGGRTGNLAVTYLGSYNLKYTAAAYHNTIIVSFNVENSSTMQSASRPPVLGYLPIWQQTAGKIINEKFETGWGSKTTQSFNWTEILYLK